MRCIDGCDSGAAGVPGTWGCATDGGPLGHLRLFTIFVTGERNNNRPSCHYFVRGSISFECKFSLPILCVTVCGSGWSVCVFVSFRCFKTWNILDEDCVSDMSFAKYSDKFSGLFLILTAANRSM